MNMDQNSHILATMYHVHCQVIFILLVPPTRQDLRSYILFSVSTHLLYVVCIICNFLLIINPVR